MEEVNMEMKSRRRLWNREGELGWNKKSKTKQKTCISKKKKRDSELRYTWQVLGGPRENNQDRKKGIEIYTDRQTGEFVNWPSLKGCM